MDKILTIDKPGEAFIESLEGIEYQIYRDKFGFLTGGVGHKLQTSELSRFKVGDTISKTQVDAWLDADLRLTERCIVSYVTAPLNQNQFNALASLIFNIGWGHFHGSGLMQSINKMESPQLIEAHWIAWGRHNGIDDPELIVRRHKEFNLFLKK